MLLSEKIRKGTFKHIESELYAYHDTLKEIERLKKDIYLASPILDEVGIRSNSPSDPTGKKVATMLMHRRINQLEQITAAISEVYNKLPNEKKKLIKVVYWTKPQTLTWDGIAIELNVSRRQALYWRDEIVYAIARILGWR